MRVSGASPVHASSEADSVSKGEAHTISSCRFGNEQGIEIPSGAEHPEGEGVKCVRFWIRNLDNRGTSRPPKGGHLDLTFNNHGQSARGQKRNRRNLHLLRCRTAPSWFPLISTARGLWVCNSPFRQPGIHGRFSCSDSLIESHLCGVEQECIRSRP